MHQIDNGIKENFFQWNGRLNRKRYIKRLLALGAFSVVAYLVLGFLALALGDPSMQPDESTALGIFGLLQLLRIPITISGYMLMIRRLHDVGLSGYYALLSLVPLINLGLVLYLLFKQGTQGDNSYGPDPLGGVAAPEPRSEDVYENPYARATYADTPTDIASPTDRSKQS